MNFLILDSTPLSSILQSYSFIPIRNPNDMPSQTLARRCEMRVQNECGRPPRRIEETKTKNVG